MVNRAQAKSNTPLLYQRGWPSTELSDAATSASCLQEVQPSCQRTCTHVSTVELVNCYMICVCVWLEIDCHGRVYTCLKQTPVNKHVVILQVVVGCTDLTERQG